MSKNPINPFNELFESNKYPHARTLRTSFIQKFWDTFNALTGNAPFFNRNPHLGIFDYLTIGISASLYLLMVWSWDKVGKNVLANLLIIPVTLINIPITITRFAFGIVGTIVLSPLTALIHGISKCFAGNSLEEALSLTGSESGSLKNYLEKAHIDVEALNVIVKKRDCSPNSYQLMFWNKYVGASSGLVCDGCLYGGCDENHAPFSIDITEKNTTDIQSNNLHSFFALNVGNVVTNIECSDTLSDVDKSSLLNL